MAAGPERVTLVQTRETVDWKDVLWREWRHTEDSGYARLIYSSLADGAAPLAARRLAEDSGRRPWVAALATMLYGVVWAAAAATAAWLTVVIALGGGGVFWVLSATGTAAIVVYGLRGFRGAMGSRRRRQVRVSTWREVLTRLDFRIPEPHRKLAGVGLGEPGGPMFPLHKRARLPLWRRPAAHAEVRRALRHPDAPGWAQRIGEPPEPTLATGDLLDDVASDSPERRQRARFWLVERGGESLPPLLDRLARGAFDPVEAARLLESVLETSPTRRLRRPSRWLCHRCLTRVAKRRARIGGAVTRVYVGCRTCGATRDLFEHPGPVFAVLDQADWERESRDGVLRVNWLTRAKAKDFEGLELFDFDRVEIVGASDQDVAHFLVDITSDTDGERRKRYRTMPVTVEDGCRLSPNTLKALRTCFPAM